jgi:pimeloyl-ACP methyl ester carboxylesterase
MNLTRMRALTLGAAALGVGALVATRWAKSRTGPTTLQRFVRGPVGRLFIDDGGEGGLPVLFVHSFAGSVAHWQTQLAQLRKERRAIAMDMRGHGQSAEPVNDDYRIEQLARDIAAVADRLHLDRFVLVGHSMGGQAAAAYAGEHPDRLAGLVLVGTPGRIAAEQSQQIIDSLHHDYDKVMGSYWGSLLKGAKPEVRQQLKHDMLAVQRDPSMAMIQAGFHFDPVPALKRFEGPVLLIDTPHGDGPGALHTLLPQLDRHLMSGTSHWPQLDKPRLFNKALDGFLADLG